MAPVTAAPETVTRQDAPRPARGASSSRGVVFAAGAHDGPTWYRVEVPARWLADRGYPVRVVYDELSERAGDLDPIGGRPVGTLANQRGCDPTLLFAVLALQGRGIRFVYDFDDDVWAVPDWNYLKPAFTAPKQRTMTALIRVADLVTVSTERLGDRAELLNWRVRVIPNALPPDAIEPPRPRRLPGFRVGWAGSATHTGDWAPVEGVFLELLRRWPDLRLVFMGWGPEAFAGHARVEWHPWVQPPRYYQALADLELDVFVAPLVEHPFNEAKSPLKLLEAGVMGWPIVCAEVGPYRAGPGAVPAIRVGARDPQGWAEALGALRADAGWRRALGEAARAHVLGAGMIDRTGPRWAEALGLEA